MKNSVRDKETAITLKIKGKKTTGMVCNGLTKFTVIIICFFNCIPRHTDV